MKKQILLYISVLSAVLLSSCEEVIDVDLNTAAPRLVVDAALKWEKGTSGSDQTIKLTTTTGYFDQIIPTVSGAEVNVTAANGSIFNFIEIEPNSGEYICNNFVPQINENYTLSIQLNGVTYTANETLVAVPEIDKIEQDDDGGFGGGNIELKFFFTDNGLTNDFYLFRNKLSRYDVPQYSVSRDEFYQGNQAFDIYSNEDIKAGDTVDFTLHGISQGYFNYMQILLSIAGNASGGGPFQSPPATVRGNIVNTSDVENYVLGFFSLSETTSVQYTVQ